MITVTPDLEFEFNNSCENVEKKILYGCGSRLCLKLTIFRINALRNKDDVARRVFRTESMTHTVEVI